MPHLGTPCSVLGASVLPRLASNGSQALDLGNPALSWGSQSSEHSKIKRTNLLFTTLGFMVWQLITHRQRAREPLDASKLAPARGAPFLRSSQHWASWFGN